MNAPLFDEHPIAVIWDFDKTLIPGSMQKPLFEHFNTVDEHNFWDEADHLDEFYRQQGLEVSQDTLYLNHILNYVRAGRFSGLSNELLRELGRSLEFNPGVEAFLERSKQMVTEDETYSTHKVMLEHYVVSTGLRQMILGSKIAPFIEKVWACEFAEQVAEPGYRKDRSPGPSSPGIVQEIVYTVNHTTKTRAIFEINKGVNRDPRITVNDTVDPADRRVPFENMIYIADGVSDVPGFSIVNERGGQTYAVYDSKSDNEFEQAFDLNRQRRVNAFGPADYQPKSQSARWIETAIRRRADEIVATLMAQRSVRLKTGVAPAPHHVDD